MLRILRILRRLSFCFEISLSSGKLFERFFRKYERERRGENVCEFLAWLRRELIFGLEIFCGFLVVFGVELEIFGCFW